MKESIVTPPVLFIGGQLSGQGVRRDCKRLSDLEGVFEDTAGFRQGDSLLQTFDCLEVAEFSAKSLVKSRPPGLMIPINGEQEELRMAFFKF